MTRRRKTEARRALEFAWMLAGIGLGLAAFALWRHHPVRAGVAAAGGLAALALALLARPIWIAAFRGWMMLAEGLGWVTTRVFLTLFYFLLLTPFGLVRRLMGKPTLDTEWHDGRGSYWIERDAVERSIGRYSKRY